MKVSIPEPKAYGYSQTVSLWVYDGLTDMPNPREGSDSDRLMVEVAKTDEDGNTVYDENGDPVMVEEPATDKHGNPLFKPKMQAWWLGFEDADHYAAAPRGEIIRKGATIDRITEADIVAAGGPEEAIAAACIAIPGGLLAGGEIVVED